MPLPYMGEVSALLPGEVWRWKKRKKFREERTHETTTTIESKSKVFSNSETLEKTQTYF
jgi:hypothetical protein